MSVKTSRADREYAAQAYLPNSYSKPIAKAWIESGEDKHGIMRIERLIATARAEGRKEVIEKVKRIRKSVHDVAAIYPSLDLLIEDYEEQGK